MIRSIHIPVTASLCGTALLAGAGPAHAFAAFPVAPVPTAHGSGWVGLTSGLVYLGPWAWLPIAGVSALCIAALTALLWQQRRPAPQVDVAQEHGDEAQRAAVRPEPVAVLATNPGDASPSELGLAMDAARLRRRIRRRSVKPLRTTRVQIPGRAWAPLF